MKKYESPVISETQYHNDVLLCSDPLRSPGGTYDSDDQELPIFRSN